MLRRHFPLAVAAVIAFGLGACHKSLEAPFDRGVCWHLAKLPNGQLRFNKLADNQPDLEHCAAQLEHMRLSFAALGAISTEMTGAYQGQFLFLEPDGVYTAQSYTGARYPFLVRTGDGRLAKPSAMPAS